MDKNNIEEFDANTLDSGFNNPKSENEWNGFEGIIGLMLVYGLFADWGSKSQSQELEKRLSKLETKTEMLEKIILK